MWILANIIYGMIWKGLLNQYAPISQPTFVGQTLSESLN